MYQLQVNTFSNQEELQELCTREFQFHELVFGLELKRLLLNQSQRFSALQYEDLSRDFEALNPYELFFYYDSERLLQVIASKTTLHGRFLVVVLVTS